jgi:hypothetical protein
MQDAQSMGMPANMHHPAEMGAQQDNGMSQTSHPSSLGPSDVDEASQQSTLSNTSIGEFLKLFKK